MKKVSIIIPCYNQGQFIDEAIFSVKNQTYENIEIIVVNDGSTDELTLSKFKELENKGIFVLHTNNQGLSMARNNGIRESTGDYILPLDADDKIHNAYTEKAVEILDKNSEVGIVYCEAELFGEKTGKWDLPEYSFERILYDNMIFCSAFFRRIDYDKTIGYNPNMKYGAEDWDFWLSLIEIGCKVYQIPETLFYYRYLNTSMTRVITKEQTVYLRKTAYRNHLKLYAECFHDPLNLFYDKKEIEIQLLNTINSIRYRLLKRFINLLHRIKHKLTK